MRGFFSPDGQILASASDDKTIKLWEVKTGKLIHVLGDWSRGEYFGHSGVVRAIAFSSDGQTLASGAKDKNVKVWQLGDDISDPNYRRVMITLSGHLFPVRAIAFSSDGQTLASGSEDNTIKLWDLNLGNTVQTLCNYYQGVHYIYTVAFNPDGQTLASGGRDGNIKIWQIERGEILQTLEGHEKDICVIVFHPQGDMIASGNVVLSVAFNPKNNILAIGNVGGIINI